MNEDMTHAEAPIPIAGSDEQPHPPRASLVRPAAAPPHPGRAPRPRR